MSYRRHRMVRDPDFDLFMARRPGHGHRVYEWHVRFWAADPSHPNHVFGAAYFQEELFG